MAENLAQWKALWVEDTHPSDEEPVKVSMLLTKPPGKHHHGNEKVTSFDRKSTSSFMVGFLLSCWFSGGFRRSVWPNT